MSHRSTETVDAVQRAFERALLEGGNPVIEDFLPRVSENDRQVLLAELIATELRNSVITERRTAINDYLERFQTYREVVELLLHGNRTTSALPSDANGTPGVPLRPGELIGRYRLEKRLGQGGCGEVWHAHDPVLDRDVALKTPRSDRPIDPSFNFDLVREGQKLAKLSHRSIVSVLDAGDRGGRAFLISDLKRGGTLQDRIRGGQVVPIATAVQWVIEIAEAVQHAHEQGFVHRDLKPSNILFDDRGRLCVCDFGISASEFDQLDESPGTLGTVGYMSPEQATGNARLAGPASDVYSLGAILYVLLTGRLPFVAKTIPQYRDQLLHRPPKPLRSINSEIPTEIEAVCLQCLERRPTDRPPTCLAVAELLKSWCEKSTPPQPVHPPSATRPSFRWLSIGAAAALVVLISFWRPWERTHTTAGSTAAELSQIAATTTTSVLPIWATPVVVCWSPTNDAVDRHSYDEAHQEYVFQTGDVSLFQVGRADGSIIKLDAQFAIESEDDVSTVGVFWCLSDATRTDAIRYCWAIEVGKAIHLRPYQIQVTAYGLAPFGGRTMIKSRDFTPARLEWTDPSQKRVHLVATVDGKSVRQIEVNGKELLPSPIVLPDRDWSVEGSGGFGFTGYSGEISVSEFRVERVPSE